MPPSTSIIGFIGLGRMGTPMVRHLAEAGYAVRAFDVDEAAASRAAGHPNVVKVATPGDVLVPGGVLITMLPDGRIVRSVLHDLLADGSGPLARLRDGGAVIDMSSSDPTGTRQLGETLQSVGVTLVDAPVSGGVAGAEAGTLSVLVGGEPDAFATYRPLLDSFAGNVWHVGPLGAGHALKALNNLLSATGLLAAAETLSVGAKFGIDPKVMLDVINASTGRNNSTERKFPQFVLTRSFDSGFSIDLMVKDLRTAIQLAHDTDSATPLGALVAELYAVARNGLAEGADHTSIVEWVEQQTHCRLEG